MPDGGKRKKFHDKDKYYHLAKEQGYRSRAAFKLTQINRKFPCLEQCETAVLDLCAAPGGWTQVAARTCPKSAQIVAVDILPIRGFKGHPNINTIVGDITTDKAKSDIKHAIAGKQVDLVLHDGAPNVGAEYGKDAYEQNEIALHALRCATQHLRRGGTFVTKIYRSRDYASYHWLLQQLFDDVSVFKPKASRQQSAEIFLVAQKYKAPAKIDPRMLDPKHIFEAVEGQTTGGGNRDTTASVSIFHKNYEKPKRQRGGYDMEFFDASLRHVTPVREFISMGFKEAVQILGQSTSMEFVCGVCSKKTAQKDDCTCSFLLHHPFTTNEIQTNVSDLQVLNKADFKDLLHWRAKMQDALSARKEEDEEDDDDVEGGEEGAGAPSADSDKEEDSDEEEQQIQSEISEMRQRRLREKKRKVKKERAAAAKRRRHAALGMDLNAIEVPDNEKLFSLATITTKGDLAAAAEVNLDEVTDEQLFGDADDDVVVGKQEEVIPGDDAERLRRRERDLDEAYELYLESTKSSAAKKDTKMQKRSKKLQRMKVMEEAAEDQEMIMSEKGGIGQDTMTYAKMLQGDKGSDDDSSDDSDESDDGFNAEPVTPEVHAAMQRRKQEAAVNSNPLIHKFDEEPSSVKAARWFSNPLFESIQKTAQSAAIDSIKSGTKAAAPYDSDSDSDADVDDESEIDNQVSKEKPNKGASTQKKNEEEAAIDADDVLASMPKTDKQKRHEKRLKQLARDEKKKARRAQKLDDEEGEFQLAPAVDDDEEEEEDEQLKNLSEPKKKQVLAAREQIKAGMGKALDAVDDNKGFEVVGEEMDRPLPLKDDRKYDSENEDYDSDDYAETLALGTMMLRKSKEKALVDASYNRYAWNDAGDLPEWFMDDEKKHYRPQLPIPPALVAKMKEKMMALAVKPIQKVAEARARKNKRAKSKLAAAKQKAEAVANSSEMSESMKLKAISKALRSKETRKPGKTYVVAKAGRGGAAGKGVKLVDKRMRSDKRSLDRVEKKRKKGKQNGLVGSKKRRNHK